MHYIDGIIMSLNHGKTLMGDWEIIHKFTQNRKLKVELGTADGLSTILISRNGGVTYTIDRDNNDIVRRYLNQKFSVLVLRDDTVRAASLFMDDSVDFLFIDGGHEYEQVKADYYAWFPKVAMDGVILFHDMDQDHPGVWRFWEEEVQEEIRFGRLREIVQKPMFETVTKVFVKEAR